MTRIACGHKHFDQNGKPYIQSDFVSAINLPSGTSHQDLNIT